MNRLTFLILSLFIHSVGIYFFSKAFKPELSKPNKTYVINLIIHKVTETHLIGAGIKSHFSNGRYTINELSSLKKGKAFSPFYITNLAPKFFKGNWASQTLLNNSKRDSRPHPTLSIDPASDTVPLFKQDSHSLMAFDLLADKINFRLEYPKVLIENSISGTASVTLVFDKEGKIDEIKSQIMGSHKLLRGLFTKATREGILDWYRSSALRLLNPDQFKNQIFYADFKINSLTNDLSNVAKDSSGAYHYLRRRSLSTCLSPIGIDIGCAAIKTFGFINNKLSATAQSEFLKVTDQLEDYDRLGFSGLNTVISQLIAPSPSA